MEGSARFHSLSGLAGVASGLFALTGCAVFYLYFGFSLTDPFLFVNYRTVPFLMTDGLIVLAASLLAAYGFTLMNARKHGEKLWTPVFRRVLLYWSIPLVAGGIIMLGFLRPNGPILFPSAIALTILFYGLALVSASRFTLNVIFWQGIAEVILGIAGFYLWKYSLLFWATGFGIVNIVFGLVVYTRYEKQEPATEVK
jgi:hypothetical protein